MTYGWQGPSPLLHNVGTQRHLTRPGDRGSGRGDGSSVRCNEKLAVIVDDHFVVVVGHRFTRYAGEAATPDLRGTDDPDRFTAFADGHGPLRFEQFLKQLSKFSGVGPRVGFRVKSHVLWYRDRCEAVC